MNVGRFSDPALGGFVKGAIYYFQASDEGGMSNEGDHSYFHMLGFFLLCMRPGVVAIAVVM